jgi:hypothetical protein
VAYNHQTVASCAVPALLQFGEGALRKNVSKAALQNGQGLSVLGIESALRVVAEQLPKILPNVLINKRYGALSDAQAVLQSLRLMRGLQVECVMSLVTACCMSCRIGIDVYACCISSGNPAAINRLLIIVP